jgi:hypothetical protein
MAQTTRLILRKLLQVIRNLLPLLSRRRNVQIAMRNTRNMRDVIGVVTEVISGKTVPMIRIVPHLLLRNAWSLHTNTPDLGNIIHTKVNEVMRISLLVHLFKILQTPTLRLHRRFIVYNLPLLLKMMLRGSPTQGRQST